MERKLAAILSADVQGYSRLMGEDDEATIRTLTAYREAMTTLIGQHHGRVVDTPGDNLLAEFASAVNAVQGAVAIQKELRTRNAELPAHRRMAYRIGVNLGDVVAEEGRLYGDGVNIAARLESLAEAGGICISGKVFEEVQTKVSVSYDYVGDQRVKNIAQPVPVYKVQFDQTADRTGRASAPPDRTIGQTRPRRWPWAVGALVGLIVVGAVTTLWRTESVTEPAALREESSLPSAPTLPLPDKPSIAVLPFTNMSGDPEQEYFSDGITDTLITDLSKLSGLFIIARHSVFAYKGQAVTVAQVGRELGVHHVLEGSVQKTGDRVRINAQLVDVSTGGHLWAERYDRELHDLFQLQDEIARKIVFALKVTLTPAEQERFRRAPTDSLEAYEAVLRGEAYFLRWTKEANEEARQQFESAIELDPGYAAAYAWLGWTYWSEVAFQWSQDPQDLDQAFALGQHAHALDASLAETHQLLAQTYLWRDRQHEQAIAAGKQAIILDPNYADGYNVLAALLTLSGRPQEAIGFIEQAMRLNPHYPANYVFELGLACVWTGQYEEAIAALRRTLVLNPAFIYAHMNLAFVYSELGRDKEAQAAIAEVLRINPQFSLEMMRQSLPFKDTAVVERLIAGLTRAGLK